MSEEVLYEIRDMNKTIKIMLTSHLADSARLRRMEEQFTVSGSLTNTSMGATEILHIYNSNNSYVICSTQAQPIYATANTPQQVCRPTLAAANRPVPVTHTH
jgi:hypothetical protein